MTTTKNKRLTSRMDPTKQSTENKLELPAGSIRIRSGKKMRKDKRLFKAATRFAIGINRRALKELERR